ncbi:sulfatase [uncultured Alistipes sp.]|uniref:sulfatase n=1 Tax=uncultured Alistipes sp. TaxID=538949 RepID=UPI002620EC7C|nr:sulfatase [uncultured Alistipes sp.]
MQRHHLTLPLAALLPGMGAAADTQPSARPDDTTLHDPRPNIILFMVDDMGWQDTSVPFWTERTFYNERYETPNMERLAREGMMFTQAYACSVSSPSRCSLMTGCNSARHGVTSWTLQKNVRTDGKSATLIHPDWNYNGIAQVPGTNNTFVADSFVELLHRSGYHTIHCGKAHWGAIDTPGENPCHFGFETNIAGHAAGGLATYLSELNYGHDKDGKPYALNAIPGLRDYWQTGTFVTEALTQEALKALDKAAAYNQPFYLYMSHYAIHIPIDRDKRYFEKYKSKGLSDKEAAYASLIEGMDKSLGDILDWLDAHGQTERTIFIFMSDNGGFSTDAAWRDEPLHTQNYPLNSGKGSAYEGGIREPMIVRWPGVVEPGSRCDKYLIIEDFYPTILEMAGIDDYEVRQEIDGISFVPLLKGTGDPSRHRSLYWNYPHMREAGGGPGISMTTTIRRDNWKLIYYYETGKKELFDIPNDISEKHDLAAEHPEIVKKLSADLGHHLRRVGAFRPSFRATGKPCPWPDEV